MVDFAEKLEKLKEKRRMAKIVPSKKVGTTKAPQKAVATKAAPKTIEYEEGIPGFDPEQAKIRAFRPPVNDGRHQFKLLPSDADNPEPKVREYETAEGVKRRDFTVNFRAEITDPEDPDFGNFVRCFAYSGPRKTGKKNSNGDPIYSSQVADLLVKLGATPTGKSSEDAALLYEAIQQEPEIAGRTRWRANLSVTEDSSEADRERSRVPFLEGQSKFPQSEDGTFEPLREVPEDTTRFMGRGPDKKEFEFSAGEPLWTSAVVVEWIPNQ